MRLEKTWIAEYQVGKMRNTVMRMRGTEIILKIVGIKMTQRMPPTRPPGTARPPMISQGKMSQRTF